MQKSYYVTKTRLQRAVTLVLAFSFIISLFSFVPASVAAAEETATTNAKVHLRKSADKESTSLQTLPEGEEVTLLSTSGSWYKVRYGKYTGYVMKQYITTGSHSQVTKQSQIDALGDAPGAMRIGDSNSDVKKLQQALKILGYYTGKLDGDYGDGTTKAVMEYQDDHDLLADGVAGKETVKSIFGSCAKTSLSKDTTTANTKSSSSSSSKTSSGSSKSSSGKSYPEVSSIEEIGSAPKPTRVGDSGTDVVKLQQALKVLGYYGGTIDGSYGEGTESAVKQLQKKRSMKADGIAGAATIRVLFGTTSSSSKSSSSTNVKTEAKKYTTKTLDWFEDNVTKVIPKNAKFTIKDVKTGKTFEAVRWSGSNHMDTEPRTSEDTAILKSIYGGSWSWRRRAILILYNGNVYAASMNGMPHGTSTIDNGFDGHFCIHFKNSMTHGTKKVDDDHQKAVTTASKATW